MCDRLAALGRAGYGVRSALIELPARTQTRDEVLVSVGRRASLGAPIALCLEPLRAEFGGNLPRLSACLESTSGTNWASALEELAASIRERTEAERAAAVAGSGATLSAKTIAILPLLMLPVVARQLTDPLVATSIFLGLALGASGYRWLVRVIPAPNLDDPMAVLADDLAALLRTGLSFDAAMRTAISTRPCLTRALHRADLGASWPVALATDAAPIASAIADAERTGSPLGEVLRRSASAIRREAQQRFERKVERAPVKMVVPLVCCILPSFVLVAIVPLLRGLAHPA